MCQTKQIILFLTPFVCSFGAPYTPHTKAQPAPKVEAPTSLPGEVPTSLVQKTEKPEKKGAELKPTIEAKVGYFFFATSEMREIFNHGGIDVQLSGTYPVWEWLEIYLSAEYLRRDGHSLNFNQKTYIWELPVSAGLRPVVTISSWAQYYFTLGPRYFFVKLKNSSPYINNKICHNGIGGFVNMGFNFFPCEHLLIDLFGEYSYEKMHYSSSKKNVYGQSIQVGGYTFGGGIGYAF